MTRYIILGMGRSGTTVTHRCVAGHPQVAALSSEVGPVPFFTQGITAFTYGHGCAPEERANGYLRLFDAICGVRSGAETMALGLKCAMNKESDARAVVESIRAYFPGIKVIFTHRSDLVAQYASLLRARRTGIWGKWKGQDDRRGEVKLSINVYDFMRYVDEAFRVNRLLRGLSDSRELLEINYERDVLNGDIEKDDRIFQFLGVPPVPVTWLDLEKLSPPVGDYVQNHAELETILEDMRLRFEAGEQPISDSQGDRVRRRERSLEFLDRARRAWAGARRMVSRA